MPSCSATPSMDPAAMTGYSGPFSQKYFKAEIAAGASWTSSNIISVSLGVTTTPVSILMAIRIRWISKSWSKICCITGLWSKFT